MDEEARQEQVAAIIGALSTVDLQLQEIEDTAEERAQIFWDEAEESETPTSDQFNAGWHMLKEIRSEVQELREYIDRLQEFVRTGTATNSCPTSPPEWETLAQPDQTRIALKNAASSFEKTANALYVIGRALEIEELDVYADHLYNLSESVEAEEERARSVLESEEKVGRETAPSPLRDPFSKTPKTLPSERNGSLLLATE